MRGSELENFLVVVTKTNEASNATSPDVSWSSLSGLVKSALFPLLNTGVEHMSKAFSSLS